MTKKVNKQASRGRPKIAELTAELTALGSMTVAELSQKYAEVFGHPTATRNKDYLRKKIAWRLQELAEGGLRSETRKRIEELSVDAVEALGLHKRKARTAPATAPIAEQTLNRDPRLPAPGTTLTRTFGDVEHKVVVLGDGFEYQGRRYKSLSKIAREITGMSWNGYGFFGLISRAKGEKKGAA